MLSHVKVIKSDSLCHAARTMSFIVPSVHCVTDNVLVPSSTLDHVCQTTKVTFKKNKRTCRLVNHFIDNSCSHTLADLKFVLIKQVATKTDTFLEHREGYWQAQLWTYEPHGFNAKKEFNSGRRREFLS